ncbi:hypothetical protein KBY27_05215 [Ruegeria pomeroyi]|uniref:Uncharacterized protein n=1 Tax=Ruegeria pomeroyi TaxID=89184 RepID=A0A9Q3WIW9_9RHOB|nr:hypothetical protein [Ruegeria pomeroyi]MCE8536846.1 hypothetical protein [Ruegeria pomeroyi]
MLFPMGSAALCLAMIHDLKCAGDSFRLDATMSFHELEERKGFHWRQKTNAASFHCSPAIGENFGIDLRQISRFQSILQME